MVFISLCTYFPRSSIWPRKYYYSIVFNSLFAPGLLTRCGQTTEGLQKALVLPGGFALPSGRFTDRRLRGKDTCSIKDKF